jgi:hypothetical protein
VDYPLFTGSILSWEPNYAGGMLSNGTVTVTANDALATLALHTFDSRWVEETRALARTAATWADVYVLKGDASTAAWDNIGSRVGGDYGTATVVPRTAAVGEVSYGTPASLTLEASAEFKPSSERSRHRRGLVPAGAPAGGVVLAAGPHRRLPATCGLRAACSTGRRATFTIRLLNNAGVLPSRSSTPPAAAVGPWRPGSTTGRGGYLGHRVRLGHRDLRDHHDGDSDVGVPSGRLT